MSQDIFNDIDPNITSGVQLADLLNLFKDAVRTGFSGTSRPANLGVGGYWIDSSTVGSDGLYKYKFWDGTNSITIFTINKNTQQITPAPAENNFQISKISDDSVGPVLSFLKKRITGGGQTLDGDILGRADFSGYDSGGVPYVMARVEVKSTDDVTGANQGSYMAIFNTQDETANLLEVLRITGDGRFGIGVSTPEKKLHVHGTGDDDGVRLSRTDDSATGPEISTRKKRQTGTNGRTVSGDSAGAHSYHGTDEAGNAVELVRVEAFTSEDTSTTDQGSKYLIKIKKIGDTTFTTQIEVGENVKITDLQVTGDTRIDGFQYWGDPTVNGCFRQGMVGADFKLQVRVAGVWEDREESSP